MAKNYSLLESKVISLFKIGSIFELNGNQYKTIISEKPRVQKGGGEPKTDCYIKAIDIDNQKPIELKISCKLKKSNEFQENKISSKRAEELFGPNWESIIMKTSIKIKNQFNERELNYPNGKGRTKLGHIILGWKLEIANKPRTLSSKLELSDKEIRDYIYKGTNQTIEKRDALIGSEIVPSSGIASHILITETEDINSIEDILDQIEDIDNHHIEEHYLIFTSNGYRIKPGKTDGNRPLAVRVEWNADLSKKDIFPIIKYDSPLTKPSKSNDMKKLADIAMEKIPGYKDKYKDKN